MPSAVRRRDGLSSNKPATPPSAPAWTLTGLAALPATARSRDGRVNPPKLGMLRMVVDAVAAGDVTRVGATAGQCSISQAACGMP